LTKVEGFIINTKELSVELYSTENKEKSSVVERWDRTMKKRKHKYFTANDTQKYIDVLDKFLKKCNTTRHSSIQMTPVEASKKENELTVFINLYPFERLPSKPEKFAIGDKVRIRKKKGSLRKATCRTGLKRFSFFQKYNAQTQ